MWCVVGVCALWLDCACAWVSACRVHVELIFQRVWHKCVFNWHLVLASTEFGIPLNWVFAIFRNILEAPRKLSRV